jgi:4-aminobutyrate aminotransferase-like enzyme
VTRIAKEYQPLETSSSYDTIVDKRQAFLSPSLRTFQAYSRPLVLQRGDAHYLWDVDGKKYVDLMAQNLCIEKADIDFAIDVLDQGLKVAARPN